jgi:hypothetical protein
MLCCSAPTLSERPGKIDGGVAIGPQRAEGDHARSAAPTILDPPKRYAPALAAQAIRARKSRPTDIGAVGGFAAV